MHSSIAIIKMLLEIGILWVIIYVIIIFARGTRGVNVLRGLILVGLFYIITQKLELETINWIFTKLFPLSLITFLIIFQPELRRGLASIGQHRWAGFFFKEQDIIRDIVNASVSLANKKTGALIAIERESRLLHYVESGVEIDGRVSTELLQTIFMPNGPLHDGGVILSGNRIIGAGCLFPLTQNPKVATTTGTRHRAALGLSEETDAAVIVVSEETGGISVATCGKLTPDLDRNELERLLKNLCKPDKKARHFKPGICEGDK